jgi:hypothetical protein
VCVFFTGVKSFREARGSLFLLFFHFVSDNLDGSDIRNTAVVCRYDIAS